MTCILMMNLLRAVFYTYAVLISLMLTCWVIIVLSYRGEVPQMGRKTSKLILVRIFTHIDSEKVW